MSELVQRRKAMAEEMMRDAICEAAATVLAEVGFEALTMERVAEAVGSSKGTLYNYFHDKDALVTAVVERTFSPLMTEMSRAFDAPTDIAAALVRAVQVILEGVVERRALGQVLCGRELSPVLSATLLGRRLRLHGLFEEAFRQAAAAGLLRMPCEHPEQLGRCLALALHGVIDLHIHHADVCPSVEQEVRILEQCMIRPWFTGVRVGRKT